MYATNDRVYILLRKFSHDYFRKTVDVRFLTVPLLNPRHGLKCWLSLYLSLTKVNVTRNLKAEAQNPV